MQKRILKSGRLFETLSFIHGEAAPQILPSDESIDVFLVLHSQHTHPLPPNSRIQKGCCKINRFEKTGIFLWG